jgi:hypothetical protein
MSILVVEADTAHFGGLSLVGSTNARRYVQLVKEHYHALR